MKTTSLVLLFFMSLLPNILAAGEPLTAGQPAPLLTVVTDEGKDLDLADVYAKGPTLVYFYPKADTPGCTAQSCNLRDNWDAVQAAGITVLGVSNDGVSAQAKFRDKYDLPFTLIADKDKSLGEAFGVQRTLFVQRSAFLIKDGKVVWADPRAKPATQSQDVLAAMAALTENPA